MRPKSPPALLHPAVAGKPQGEGTSPPLRRSPYATKTYVILLPVTPANPQAANRIVLDVKLSARAAREVVGKNPGSYIVLKTATK